MTRSSDAWRRIDLGGGVLQHANRELARRLKRRRTAYALLFLAPLGIHRDYLRHRRGAWLWRGATVAVLAVALIDWRLAAWLAAAMGAAVAAEAWWIGRRVPELNKRIRREVYLAQDAAPPAGFAGRSIEPPAQGRAPSFAEQERLLRELARARRDGGDRGADGDAA